MPGLDGDDFISLLSSEESSLPASALAEFEEAGPPAPGGNENGEDWKNDPLPLKLDKIRATVLNAKTPSEVHAAAATMPVGDWFELVVKMSPKNIQVDGAISFTHMLAEMAPINKEQYRLPLQVQSAIIEAELAD